MMNKWLVTQRVPTLVILGFLLVLGALSMLIIDTVGMGMIVSAIVMHISYKWEIKND